MTAKSGWLKLIELGTSMTKISKSPDRHTFQKEGYVKRMKEKSEPVNEDYLDYFQKIIEQDKHKFADSKSRENNMEYDLLSTDWILDKVRNSKSYAQNLYAAMCNNDFQKLDVIPILKEQTWSCSWRYAGGIIADMREQGDYIDWYCSGSGGLNSEYEGDDSNEEWQKRTGYVPEGKITEEIRNDLQRLRWVPVPNGDWEDFENR
jgi:hypothetical protein